MRATWTVVLSAVLCVTLIGCGKDEKKPAAKEPAGDTANKPPPAPEPFAGALSYERMEQAKASVKPGDAWEAAFALVQSKAGKPTAVDGANHNWYLLDGEKCHELSLQSDGTNVGSVSLGTYDKIMKSKYDKCLPKTAAAGGDDDTGDDDADEDDTGDEDTGDDEDDKDDEEGGW